MLDESDEQEKEESASRVAEKDTRDRSSANHQKTPKRTRSNAKNSREESKKVCFLALLLAGAERVAREAEAREIMMDLILLSVEVSATAAHTLTHMRTKQGDKRKREIHEESGTTDALLILSQVARQVVSTQEERVILRARRSKNKAV